MNQPETFFASGDTSLSLDNAVTNEVILGITIDATNRQFVSVASRSLDEIDILKNNEELSWHGDSNSDRSISPMHLFCKTSKSMSRHSRKWLGLCPSPKVYRNSDNGRRKKVENISFFGRYDFSDEDTQYESPDEDWYYDPRSKSKWNWENDYCSLASENDENDASSAKLMSSNICK